MLLLLSLVLLAIVSAIVAFDRWPESGSRDAVERIAVDRPEAPRVETELVRADRQAPLVRGVVAVRAPGVSATALGASDVVLVADRGPGGQSDGGGFGPPPPPVPFAAPGEGGRPGGGARSTSTFVPSNGGDGEENPIQAAACDAREALGEAGAPLDPACKPGSRGLVRETLSSTGQTVTGLAGNGVQVELNELELTR